jgi:Phosphotransferase enzyme family
MSDRSVLGPADVSGEQLECLVAELLGSDRGETELLSSEAEEVDYDLPAITTAGRYWVRGVARVSGREETFAFFVKHVQSWSRSPYFSMVPAEQREFAEASVPWRTEPLAYRSDLGDRLPDGLTMPRALGVFDLDDKAAAIWLEVVPTETAPWDLERYAHAAHLLGRMSASRTVRELATVGHSEWDIRVYHWGRLEMQVLPVLRDPGIWQHPLIAAAFDDELRTRLLRAADRAPAIVEELMTMPEATIHGDACPNNLLPRTGADGFVLIDYGFWNLGPIGFDLGQLLVGDVQDGRRPTSDLGLIDKSILPAYVEGLRA